MVKQAGGKLEDREQRRGRSDYVALGGGDGDQPARGGRDVSWDKAGGRAVHGLGNLVFLVLFTVSWFLRRDQPTAPEAVALALSFAGVAVAAVSGWLGGELVDRHAVGIDEGAHPDSPHSLSGRPERRRQGLRFAEVEPNRDPGDGAAPRSSVSGGGYRPPARGDARARASRQHLGEESTFERPSRSGDFNRARRA